MMYRQFGREIFLSCLLSFMVMTNAANSQTARYDLVNTGVLSHSVYGQGVEMLIQTTPQGAAGAAGGIAPKALARICKEYAPSVITSVARKRRLTKPDFVAVRVVWGEQASGRYALQVYSIENGTCGHEL